MNYLSNPSSEPILFKQISIKNEPKFRKLMKSFSLVEGVDYFLVSEKDFKTSILKINTV